MTEKTTVPHPKEAKSDADHVKFAKHMLNQIEHGHYKISNVSVSRTDSGDVKHFSASFTVEDTDPKHPAKPHGL